MNDVVVLEKLSQGIVHILPTIIGPENLNGGLKRGGDHSMKFTYYGSNITFMGEQIHPSHTGAIINKCNKQPFISGRDCSSTPNINVNQSKR